MERNEVTRKKIIAQDGREITIVYSLISEQIQLVPGCRITCYGVHVASPETGDECTIRDITISRDKIDDFISLISRCGVTAVTLSDVVDDMLGVCL